MRQQLPIPKTTNSSIQSRPDAIQQIIVWSRLGVQSFGGGVATLSLIQRATVEENQWISPAEFARFWALVQLAPGVNLIGLTILIGHRVGGAWGVIIALFGLLLPSTIITITITALYTRVQHLRVISDALSGVIPATVGIGLVTGCQISFPILKRQLSQGTLALAIGLILFIGSGAVFAVGHCPVAEVIVSAGVIGAAAQLIGMRTKEPTPIG